MENDGNGPSNTGDAQNSLNDNDNEAQVKVDMLHHSGELNVWAAASQWNKRTKSRFMHLLAVCNIFIVNVFDGFCFDAFDLIYPFPAILELVVRICIVCFQNSPPMISTIPEPPSWGSCRCNNVKTRSGFRLTVVHKLYESWGASFERRQLKAGIFETYWYHH